MFFIHWIIIICPTCKNLYFNCIHRSLHSNWDSILNNNLDWRDKNMSMHYSIEKHKHFLFNLLLFSLSLLLLLLLLPFPSVLFFSSNPLYFSFRTVQSLRYVKFERKPGLLPYRYESILCICKDYRKRQIGLHVCVVCVFKYTF